jgi:uncharacterized protein (DUF1697 family)
MPKHIAFLRAINVGGHFVKMADLRAMFERMKFENVETFINSGNVIFDAGERDQSKLERRVERALRAELGYDVSTFIRSPEELAAIAASKPFSAASSRGWSALYVCFLKEPHTPTGKRALEALRTDEDQFTTRGREAYWLCRTKLTSSLVPPNRLAKALGPNTNRNITTVRKLADKYRPPV